MAEARNRAAWAHTSVVLALIANVNRDPKQTGPFKPSDFDPYSVRKNQSVPKVSIDVLKSLFVKPVQGA